MYLKGSPKFNFHFPSRGPENENFLQADCVIMLGRTFYIFLNWYSRVISLFLYLHNIKFVFQVRNRIASSNVNPFDLTIVDQTKCSDMNSTMRVEVNNETFSSHNIGQAVKKVGSKIGDGVEYAIDGGKKLLKMTSSNSDKKGLPDSEIEWLP